MALTLYIDCGGETHEIEVEYDKPARLLDHDADMLQAFTAFGAAKPECLAFLELWDFAHRNRPLTFLYNILDSQPFAEALWDALPSDYTLTDLDPSGALDRDDLLNSLAHLLSGHIDMVDEVAAVQDAKRIYQLLNALGEFEDRVDLSTTTLFEPDDGSGYSTARLIYTLRIDGIFIESWSIDLERYLVDPIWFETNVHNSTFEERRSSDDLILAVLDELTLVEDAELPEPPPLAIPEPCDGSIICTYAVLHSSLRNDKMYIVPYPSRDAAEEAKEYAETLYKQHGADIDNLMSVVRHGDLRRPAAQALEELLAIEAERVSRGDIHGVFPAHDYYRSKDNTWVSLLDRVSPADRLKLTEWEEVD